VEGVNQAWNERVTGAELSNDLPGNDFMEFFGPDYKLHVSPSKKSKNENTMGYLESLKVKLLQNLAK